MKKQNLQYRLMRWTILLITIPSLLIMALYTIGQIKEVKQKNIEMIHQRVAFQEDLIEHWIAERASDVRAISQMVSGQPLDQQQIKNILDIMQRNSKDFDSLSYIDKEGIFQASTIKIRAPSAVDTPYYKTAMSGQDYISDVVVGRNSNLPIINFSSPIYDKSGVFQGLILGSVHTKTIETLLQNNRIGQSDEILLVNSEGIMITEPRYVSKLVDSGIIDEASKRKIKLSADALRNIHIGETGTATWTNYLSERVLGAYQYMPERGWTLIGSTNEKEILAPIYTQLTIMAVGTILLIVLILPLALLLTNQIKRPIDWLIRQSVLVKEGNYKKIEIHGEFEKVPDELFMLCDTFVKMRQRIENTFDLLKKNEYELNKKVNEIQEINATLEEEVMERQKAQAILEKLNNNLESRVRERTSDLMKINATLKAEIMERQKAQSALEKLNIELESEVAHRTAEIARLDRLNLVGEMAAGIGHEVRNPMTTVRGYLQIFQKRDQFVQYQEQLATMIEELDRANAIITEFLSLAKNKTIKLRIGNLNNTLHALYPLLQTDALRLGHKIIVDIGNIPSIYYDENEIRQLILNLTRNSFEAMDKGGIIQIKTFMDHGKAVLSIQDNGTGIPQDILENIGTPFLTTKDGGTGLGLSVCYRVADRHKAKIEVHSSTEGTVFFVQFPLIKKLKQIT